MFHDSFRAAVTDDPSLRLCPDHDGWRCWTGIGGIHYTRRLKSSPPAVFRATTHAGLSPQIAKYERERGIA